MQPNRPITLGTVVASLALIATPLQAQTAIQFTAGAISSGVLVNDGALHTKLRPAAAPTFGLGIALPTGKGPYRVRFEAHYTRSTLNITTTEGLTDHLSSLTTIDVVAMAEGPLTGDVRWQAGGGALFYRPSEHQGVFLNGPVQRWLLAGGAVYSRRLTPRLSLLVSGRVDAHAFQTDVLRARNYAGSQGVQRFALSLGVEKQF